MNITPEDIARSIDHTLLKPEATPQQIDVLCREATEYRFASVCVGPTHVRRAADALAAAHRARADRRLPAIVSVAGFPLGTSLTATKADEARRALDDGATEIDMIMHLGALIAGDHRAVREDIATVARVAHDARPTALLKVILETSALTNDQIILACRFCIEAEADFVKTSTGFHPSGGATVEHVRLLRRHAAPLLVKASGGIRSAESARAMLEAGATRIGTSSGVGIMEELGRG